MAAPLEPAQMRTYFALTEAVSLLQHAVQQQLQAEQGMSEMETQISDLADAVATNEATDLNNVGF